MVSGALWSGRSFAYVLDQGAVVYHAAARALLADNDIKERYCSV
jgi:branched-chain amino acid transport system ATP-binding protein